MWDLSSPIRDQPISPALQGRFLTTGSQRKPSNKYILFFNFKVKIQVLLSFWPSAREAWRQAHYVGKPWNEICVKEGWSRGKGQGSGSEKESGIGLHRVLMWKAGTLGRKPWLDWESTCACGAKSLQSCLTLCNPMDCSPPGSSVHGTLQARIL